MSHCFETHRCEGSLRAYCSIRRYEDDGTPLCNNRDGRWHLYRSEIDDEWMTHYLHHVAQIRFCPFCGRGLT